MPEQQRQVTEEVLRVPADIKPDPNAERITNEQKRVGREAREGLFRRRFLPDDRPLNQVRLVSVVGNVFTHAVGEMPDADHKQRQHNYTAHRRKYVPQLRPHHCQEERRKKLRNSSEDGSLALSILESIALQNLVN